MKLGKKASDYSKKTDKELLQLMPLHVRNIRAAEKCDDATYYKALERAAVLVHELKKRGLVEFDFTLVEDSLNVVSKKMFARNFSEIKCAARNNNSQAILQMGMLFHSIREYSTAYTLFNKSSELGNGEAQYTLAWAYMEGKSIEPDMVESAKWFLIAHEAGYEPALKAIDLLKRELPQEDLDKASVLAREWILKNIKKPNDASDYCKASPSLGIYQKKHAALVALLVDKKKCTEQQAERAIANKIKSLRKQYQVEGVCAEKALKKAALKVYSIIK